jgi:hypothetical protein
MYHENSELINFKLYVALYVTLHVNLTAHIIDYDLYMYLFLNKMVLRT